MPGHTDLLGDSWAESQPDTAHMPMTVTSPRSPVAFLVSKPDGFSKACPGRGAEPCAGDDTAAGTGSLGTKSWRLKCSVIWRLWLEPAGGCRTSWGGQPRTQIVPCHVGVTQPCLLSLDPTPDGDSSQLPRGPQCLPMLIPRRLDVLYGRDPVAFSRWDLPQAPFPPFTFWHPLPSVTCWPLRGR